MCCYIGSTPQRPQTLLHAFSSIRNSYSCPRLGLLKILTPVSHIPPPVNICLKRFPTSINSRWVNFHIPKNLWLKFPTTVEALDRGVNNSEKIPKHPKKIPTNPEKIPKNPKKSQIPCTLRKSNLPLALDSYGFVLTKSVV